MITPKIEKERDVVDKMSYMYIKKRREIFVYKQCVKRNFYINNECMLKKEKNLWKEIEVLYRPCWYKEKEFNNTCVYRKSFLCIGMQVYREKAFLIDSDGCIVFCKHASEKMKQKEKRKKDLESLHVMVIGSTNHS